MTSTAYNIVDVADKFCSSLRRNRNSFLSKPVSTIIIETEFIDLLQTLVDYGNTHVLESFNVRLEMENTELKKKVAE
jgi:hypothetical protein